MLLRRGFLLLLGLLIGSGDSQAAQSSETQFWDWFRANETMLFEFEQNKDAVFAQLGAEMEKVGEDLTFELGPKIAGQRDFVISANGMRASFAKVEALYAAAPPLPHWNLIKFRPRRPVFDLAYGNVSVSAAAVRVDMSPNQDKSLLDLVVYLPAYQEAQKRDFFAIAFLLLDNALGERDVATRMGHLDVRALPAGPDSLSLQQLPQAFDRYFASK